MSSLNKVILIGRVAKEPELKFTPQGTAVCEFRIAVDRRRGKSGEQPTTDFIPIKAWQKLAEVCNEYLVNGKLVAIDGRLETRTYTDKDGNKRSAFDIVADDMRMLSPKSEGETAGSSGGQRQAAPAPSSQRRAPARPQPAESDIGMDDIPF